MAVAPHELQSLQEYMRRIQDEEEKRRQQGELKAQADQLRIEGETQEPDTFKSVNQSTDHLLNNDLTPEQRFSKRSVFEEPGLMERLTNSAANKVGDLLSTHPKITQTLDEWLQPEALPADAPLEDVIKQGLKTPILPPAVTKGIGGGIYDAITGDLFTSDKLKEDREQNPNFITQVGKGTRKFAEEIVGGLLTPQSLATLGTLGTSAGGPVLATQFPGMVSGTIESGKQFGHDVSQGDVAGATTSGLNTLLSGLMTVGSGAYLKDALKTPVVRPQATEEAFTDHPPVQQNQPQQQLALPPPSASGAPPAGAPLPPVPPSPVEAPSPLSTLQPPAPAPRPQAPVQQSSTVLGSGLGGLQELFEKSPHEQALDAAEAVAKKTGKKVVDVLSPDGAPIDSNLYADALNRQQDVVRSTAQKGVREKVSDFLRDAKEKLVDGLSPIEDAINYSAKKQSFTVLPRYRFSEQVERVLQSSAIAKAFAEDHGLFDVIRAPKNEVELGRFDQYMIAKHNQDVATQRGEKGEKVTGRSLDRDAQLIQDFNHEYPHFKEMSTKLRGYSDKLLDYAVDTGLVSAKQAAGWKAKYPNYVPLERVFEPETLTPQGKPSGKASLSQTVLSKQLKGSAREVESPVVSFLKRTGQIIAEGEINKTANTLIDTMQWPDNPLNLKPLRTEENVSKRIGLYSELKELKPIRQAAHDLLVANRAQVRTLQTEINRLEKKGLESALKPEETTGPADLQSSLRTIHSATEKTGIRPTRFKTEFATTKTKGAQSTKAFIERLITDPDVDIARFKKSIATRENKLGGILDNIQYLRDGFDAINQRRLQVFDESKLLRDASTQGKSVISRFVNGTKEIYQTEPWVAEAAKNINSAQLGLVEKLLNHAMRLPRLGTTGLNIPFAGSNLVKDVETSFVQGRNWRESLAVHPLLSPVKFVDSLVQALGHGEVMKQLDRLGASGALFDFGKDKLPSKIKDIRLNWYQLPYKHPLESLEHLIGTTERATRISAYKGSLKHWLGQGMNRADAEVLAAKAARNNTTNFFRKGSWGKTLNSVILFLNARIQGARGLLRAVKERPVGTLFKATLALYLPQAVATLWNLSDPKRKELYNRIDEFEKKGSIPLITPWAEYDPGKRTLNGIIKIPIAPDHQGVTTLLRHLIEKGYGTADPSIIKDAFDAVAGATIPIDLSKQGLASGLTPQLIKPSLEDYSNKDFFSGKPIIPPHMQEWLPQEQRYPWTSGTASQIGKLLDVSPLRVEHFIRGNAGGLGMEVLNATDRLQNVFRSDKNQIPVGGQGLLEGFKRRFTQASATQDLPEDAAENNKMQQYELLDKLKTRGLYRGIEAKANEFIQKAMANGDYRQKLQGMLDNAKKEGIAADDPNYKLFKVLRRRFEQTFGKSSDKTFQKMSSTAQADYLFHEVALPAFENAQTAQERAKIIDQIGDQYQTSKHVVDDLYDLEQEWVKRGKKRWIAPVNDRLQEFEQNKLP